MSSGNVTRRFVVGALGTGAAAAAVEVTGAATTQVAGASVAKSSGPVVSAPQGPAPASVSDASALVAPLGPGSTLAHWTITNVGPIAAGALTLVLKDARGGSFQLDVCARDASQGAVAPPGQSEHFDVFLANGGDGATVTHEEHGLAAMALADVIRANEHGVERDQFTTLAERLRGAPEQVRVVVRG